MVGKYVHRAVYIDRQRRGNVPGTRPLSGEIVVKVLQAGHLLLGGIVEIFGIGQPGGTIDVSTLGSGDAPAAYHQFAEGLQKLGFKN